MIVKNKFTGEVFMEIKDTTRSEAHAILRNGVKATGNMAELPRFKIYDSLMDISDKLKKNSSDLARIISIEAGKPIKLSRKEAMRAANTFQFAAEETRRAHGETVPLDVEPRGIHRTAFFNRVPVGLIYSVTPFNDPLNLVAHKIAPAIAAGNAIINKPASLAPVSALRLSEMASETDLPDHAVQEVISVGGGEISNLFLTSDAIKMITFTGGTEAAEKLVRKAGVKKYSMELGNNSPVIVWNDADLDSAAESVVDAAFESQGQNCIHAQRILVKSDVYEYFRNRLIEITSRLKIGDPLDENTDIGPMITESEAIRVENSVKEACALGSNLLAGGNRDGSFMAPTILENVPPESPVWKKEIFGPVMMIMPVESMDEAINLANDVEYGLQAGVFSSDINLAMQAIERLNFGTVLINDSSDFRIDTMPFGGMKKSGIGREGVRFSMEEMSEIKLAIIKR